MICSRPFKPTIFPSLSQKTFKHLRTPTKSSTFSQIHLKTKEIILETESNMGSLDTSVPPAVSLSKQFSRMDVGLIQKKTIGEIVGTPAKVPQLFTPLKIRGINFPNRIMVSPMCMYSCEKQDGVYTDFHLGHYGNLALRGPSLVMIEASAVESRGRLSPQDAGIWGREHADALSRIAKLTRASGSYLAIQLAHGGRKAATYPPYHNYEESGGQLGRGIVPASEGGFDDQMVAPSPIPWKEGFTVPKELSIPEIKEIVKSFQDAAKRSVDAGIDVIEIHGAHGYLIHNFLSGNTNKRTDEYGGSFKNRTRFVLEIITAVREVMPANMPLFLRVSGTDYATGEDMLAKDPNGWDIYQVIELCKKAVPLGLDVIDISSGGNLPIAKGILSPQLGFQVPLAQTVKAAKIEGLFVATVGGMHDPQLCEQTIVDEKADIVFLARQFIKDPSWVHTAADALGVKVRWASQYSWFWPLK